MNNWMIRGLRLVAAVLVVGGGIAAVSPRTAAIAVDAAARRAGVATEWAEWPAVADGVWVGRLHKQPGRQTGQPATSVAKLDGEQSLLRWEAFLASSRQETRTQFRVWGVEAQILGILLLLLTGAGWRRNGAHTPAAPTPTATPTTPSPSRWRNALARGRARLSAATSRLTGGRGATPTTTTPATTTPATTAATTTPATTPNVPVTVTTPARPVDETGGDLEVAETATPAPVAAVELTVRVTRTDGSVEAAEFGGCKVTEAAEATVVVARTITATFKAPPPAAPTSS